MHTAKSSRARELWAARTVLTTIVSRTEPTQKLFLSEEYKAIIFAAEASWEAHSQFREKECASVGRVFWVWGYKV